MQTTANSHQYFYTLQLVHYSLYCALHKATTRIDKQGPPMTPLGHLSLGTARYDQRPADKRWMAASEGERGRRREKMGRPGKKMKSGSANVEELQCYGRIQRHSGRFKSKYTLFSQLDILSNCRTISHLQSTDPGLLRTKHIDTGTPRPCDCSHHTE